MQPAVSLHQVQRTRARHQVLGAVRFVLPVVCTLLLSILAYQFPIQARVDVGEPGDRLFVPASEAQGAEQIARGEWYADQLGQQGRSRWSRERATLVLPGLGRGRDAELTLYAEGWPGDVLRDAPKQPTVAVQVGGRTVGAFEPNPRLADYRIAIPAAVQTTSPLTVTLLIAPTFTGSAAYPDDARPKGIRLDAFAIRTGGWGTQPDWLVVGGLGLATVLVVGLAERRSRRSWLVLLCGLGVTVLGATAVLAARLWLAALLPTVVVALLALLALANWRWWRSVWRSISWRIGMGYAFDYGIVVALVALCALLLIRVLPAGFAPPQVLLAEAFSGEDRQGLLRLLVWLSLLSGAGFALIATVTVLPRWVLQLRRKLLTSRLTATLLSLLAGIWLGYETWLIRTLPFVGHADYADNAVVARNLLRGRGFVVDYVTQFYNLVPNGAVTRPQETWPLLQPVLMLPSMALLGVTAFAARLPNIVFLAILTWLIYHIGARMWDRRVGLLAALLTLTNLLFFRLAIYATSDLALVVWSMAAFWLVYQLTTEHGQQGSDSSRLLRFRRLWAVARRPSWVWAGIFTGLMILQKPSSAIFVLGMGFWVLWQIERERRVQGRSIIDQARRRLPLVALWTLITVLVVTPFLVRNLQVFGKPFFSTESYDAWVLYYRGISDVAWDDLYKLYAPEFWARYAPGAPAPGRPDYTWILRWGFDLTFGKIITQSRAAWQFFAPPKGALLGYDPDGIAATWLLMLGLVTLRQRQRRLIGLVLTALIPYVIFLVLYWHTHGEERYFVPFIPWLALLAAWGVCWLFDRIAAIGRGRWAGLGGLALSLALVSVIQPHWRAIDAFLDPDNPRYWGVNWTADLEAYAWIKQNTPPDTVIMTRVPWQLNFYADRPAVMIPNADGQQIMQIAQYYGADYLLVNGSSTSLPESRGALKPLACGDGVAGWELVHTVEDRYNGAPVRIYRIPRDYGWSGLGKGQGSANQAQCLTSRGESGGKLVRSGTND